MTQSITQTQVLWYNAKMSTYEFGSWSDFKEVLLKAPHPNEIQAMERFNDTSISAIRRIVNELNRCKSKYARLS